LGRGEEVINLGSTTSSSALRRFHRKLPLSVSNLADARKPHLLSQRKRRNSSTHS